MTVELRKLTKIRKWPSQWRKKKNNTLSEFPFLCRKKMIWCLQKVPFQRRQCDYFLGKKCVGVPFYGALPVEKMNNALQGVLPVEKM